MSFTWKKFYVEFAKKLLEYKNRRQELVETIYSALGDTLNDSGTSVVNYFKKDKDTKLKDTDPFSVFAIFNRTKNDSVRKKCIVILKKTFEIQADIPSDFDGVPLLNAKRSIFVDQDGSNIEESTSLLWNLFEKVINNEEFEQEYNDALKIKGVNNNLSMGLFWICPDRFLGLDSNNRNYIKYKLGFEIDDKPNYEEYEELLNKVRASHYEDFAELSLKAWKYSKNKETETMNNNNNYIEILKKNQNIVFTGAPGTGKTYLAKQIASKMVLDNYDFENLTDKEKKIFDERVGFVQFHPSYDYTDFVEGLRPITDGNGNVGFERRDGVFKEFCKRAIIKGNKGTDYTELLNNNPTVWKVSLEGCGENPTRTDCMNNGYIRIGWPEYGVVDDFSEKDDFPTGGKVILRAFQNAMNIGDLVLSCYSNTEIDAIGIITGDYEYRKEGGMYPRYRKVKWLVKGIKENILSINGDRKMPPSTICKMTVSITEIIKIVENYSSKEQNKEKFPFIFIIDEINRGEISKIFGELFFSVDPGYRGKKGKVKTQYQNMIEDGDVFKNDFYVPDNVYIIGTMNDIDRSVESMDFAMRRRFTWIEIDAASRENILDSLGDYAEEAKARMAALNKEIEGTHELGKAYEVGPAYFLKLQGLDNNFDNLWKMNLEPLLREYLRGYNNAKKIIEDCKNAYNSKKIEVSDD